MDGFRLRAGSIIGREHTFRQANCQDKLATFEGNIAGRPCLIGVVSDGCGSGAHSEIGAGLLANFLVREIERRLNVGVELAELPGQLYPAALRYLNKVLRGLAPGDPEGRSQVVADYLLATALGFVIYQGKGLSFMAGDGLVVLNDHLSVRDQQNAPGYLAYHLLYKGTEPASFEVIEFEVAELTRLAIWTDGLKPELIYKTWGHTHPRGLQRELNLLSKGGALDDDASGIVVERL